MVKLINSPAKHLRDYGQQETLEPLDGGYYDTLAAIGLAALADSLYDGVSPEIERYASGYVVRYDNISRKIPDLGWLRYSIAASWHKKQSEWLVHSTKMDDFKIGAGKEVLHGDAVVDTKDEPKIIVERGKTRTLRVAPLRLLYGAINKLGSPTWMNACVQIAREHGDALVKGSLNPDVSFNSIVHPGGNKGGNSANAFSILNGSLSKRVSGKHWRQTILASLGLIFAARGSISDGFVIPYPQKITVSKLRDLVNTVRLKSLSIGPIMPYQGYCHYLRLITVLEYNGLLLFGVGGASFIELGAASSPAGNWLLCVPMHLYTVSEVDRIEAFLKYWQRAVTKNNNTSINRADLEKFMTGFAGGDWLAYTEGYLRALSVLPFTPDLVYKLLPETIIHHAMNSTKKKYNELAQALSQEPIQSLINVVRSRTVYRAKNTSDKASQVDYTLIQRLRDPHSADDLIQALAGMVTESRIEQFSKEKASINLEATDKNKKSSLVRESSIPEVMRLSDLYGYRTVGIAILGMAMSIPTGKK